MWRRVLLTCCILELVFSQPDNLNSASANVQWGWQMTQAGPETVGHYFVKLPQAEQQVRYIADDSGYHGAVAVTTSDQDHVHTTNFALGERGVELNSQVSNESHIEAINNLQQNQNPVEIFLLQQQFPSQGQLFQIVPNNNENIVQYRSLPNTYYTNSLPQQNYNKINVEHRDSNRNSNELSNDRMAVDVHSEEIVDTRENGPIVRVFKDHKCETDDNNNNDKNYNKNINDKLNVPNYKQRNIHGDFGARDKPVSYQNIKLNQNNKKYNYHTQITHMTSKPVKTFIENEGITKLVASTQDLITNEDLLRINHAAERVVNNHNDDIIKPRRRSNSRAISFLYNNPERNHNNRITLSAKYGNVENHDNSQRVVEEQSYQTSNNEYKFASPIVVDDSNYDNYQQQIVNNIVSTMVPYVENGYEIVDVRKYLIANDTYEQKTSEEDLVNITPRPISQNYLAPITVALRLFNANHSNFFNTVDDHEPSDSEFIPNSVKRPQSGKTVVEIQESIPVEITHINDVEYHEYLDEGRSNKDNSVGVGKSLYQKYQQSLEQATLQNNDGSNINNENQDYDENDDNESKDTFNSNEDSLSEGQVQASSVNSNAYANYYNSEHKIIQPIIIEKQVPVTKFVDRFIEKQVPYPEPVEVVKQVPVDRPVPVPVHYETIVEKPVEVTRYVDKPYPVEVFKPYPVEVRVPYPVEHKVYVDRPVHVPYPVEKIIEKQMIHQIPVPTPVGIPVGIPVEKKVPYPIAVETPVPVAVPIEKPVTVEKIVEKEVPVPYPVEKQVPYPVRHEVKVPVPYPVEKRIPVPYEKIVEKPVTVTKVVEKPVHIKVPQPIRVEVPVPRPYPVDRIIEKKVPYPVHIERIVERKVPVNVPYPVKTIVEKIVEKPVVITKYVDKPYPVEKRVPYSVEKIVERKVPYPVHVPVEVKVPYVVNREVNNREVQSGHPYEFEKVNPTTIYSYGVPQEVLANVANYIKYNQEQYKQAIPNYAQELEAYNNQQQAESQRNYQIELANAHVLKNLQNATPVHTTRWGNQYASSYHYINSTESNKSQNNYVKDNQKYYGPPPLKNYNDQWEKNNEYTERIRRTEKTPRMTNLRIEYGGFKPPLIPSTEVDLNGVPIKKNEQS